MKLTIPKVVNILKKVKPQHVEDIVYQLPLKFLDHGCFREIYKVKGVDIVIKFPLNIPVTKYHYRDYEDNIDHSNIEIKNFRSIKNYIPSLRHFIPKIYYDDFDYGIIAMEYCKPLRSSGKRSEAYKAMLKYLTQQGIWIEDMEFDNLGKNKQGRVVFLDLGYLEI